MSGEELERGAYRRRFLRAVEAADDRSSDADGGDPVPESRRDDGTPSLGSRPEFAGADAVYSASGADLVFSSADASEMLPFRVADADDESVRRGRRGPPRPDGGEWRTAAEGVRERTAGQRASGDGSSGDVATDDGSFEGAATDDGSDGDAAR